MVRSLILVILLGLQFSLAQANYTVQAGDSLSKIAQRFNLSVADLLAINQLPDPDLIEIGQILIIPSLANWSDPLPRPIVFVSLEPQEAIRGQVQLLQLRLEPESQLIIGYLGKTLKAFQQGDDWFYLLPTPVLEPAAHTNLHIKASHTDLQAEIFLPITLLQGGYTRENINLSGETSQLLDPAIVGREHALLETTCKAFSEKPLWQTKFQYPVNEPAFSSEFGTLRSYNNGPISGYHRGLDFRGESGTAVLAAATGRVSLAEKLELYGNTVVLDHGLGVCTAYMHLSNIKVMTDQTVQTGEHIGSLGATGLVTGPHLHFEVRVHGIPVAPMQWFNEALLVP